MSWNVLESVWDVGPGCNEAWLAGAGLDPPEICAVCGAAAPRVQSREVQKQIGNAELIPAGLPVSRGQPGAERTQGPSVRSYQYPPCQHPLGQ